MAAPTATLLAGAGSTTDATSYVTASVSASSGSLVLVWFVHGRAGAVPSAASSVAGASISGAVSISSITFDTVASALSRLEVWAATATGAAGAITITLPETQSGCVWSVQRVTGANTAVGTLGIRQAVTNRGNAGTVFSTTLAAFADPQNFVVQAAGFTDSGSTPKAGFTELTDTGISTPTLALASSWRDATDTSPSITLDSSVVWPSATNSGQLVATTQTLAGAGIIDSAWFAANGFGGSGTAGSPYLVDRVLFTSQVNVGDWNANDLATKYVKFTNCRFRENGGNPTPGGSAGLWVRDFGPAMVIVEDSTIAPNQAPLSSGGTTQGTDKGFYSYCPFTLTRCNIYGSNVPVGFEIEPNEATSTIQDCFLHDIWSATVDHTDIINGNMHASHIVCRHNYMDGIRVGGQWVTNGFGVYNDLPGNEGAATIQDWTIDNNYIDRCTTMFLSTTVTSKFLNPLIVTDNVWTTRRGNLYIGRSPSVQSGNADEFGTPLTF